MSTSAEVERDGMNEENRFNRLEIQEESPTKSPLITHLSSWLLCLCTCATVAFTIYFAYNCSLEVPQSPILIFPKPQRTILTLTILSQSTIFLLGQLANSLFETVRWAFASSELGIPALSFFALGSSTSTLGVLMVLLNSFKAHPPDFNQQRTSARDGPPVWGFQRQRFNTYILMLGCYILYSAESWVSSYSPTCLSPQPTQ